MVSTLNGKNLDVRGDVMSRIRRHLDACFALVFAAPEILAGCSPERDEAVSKVPESAFADPDIREAANFLLTGQTALAIAAARRSHAGVNALGEKGDTLLLVAIEKNDLAAVRALLESGANPNFPEKRAPLAVAVDKAGLPVIQALLAARANPESKAGSEPALWRAALNGRPDVVHFLASAGAGIDQPNSQNETPLIAAVQADQYRMALVLLDLGASPFATSDEGYTAGYWITRSVIPAHGVEGQARAQVVERMRAAGFPWPPPSPAEVMNAKALHAWPPR